MIMLKEQLCRKCGCEVTEHTKCDIYGLVIETICKCCNKVDEINTHLHQETDYILKPLVV